MNNEQYWNWRYLSLLMWWEGCNSCIDCWSKVFLLLNITHYHDQAAMQGSNLQCCINIAIINANPAKLGLRAEEMLNMKLQRGKLFQVMLHCDQGCCVFPMRGKPLRFRSRSMTCLLQPQLSPHQG